jgi:quinol monooxygenase YgiN
MITEYVRYRLTDAESNEFEAAYARAAQALEAAPQCLAYDLSRGIEEPDRYVLRIEWASLAEHEDGFRSGPEFGRFLAAVRPFIGQIEEMKHYQSTAVTSAAKAR